MPSAETVAACSQGLVLEGLIETGSCFILACYLRGSGLCGHARTGDPKNNGCSEQSYSKL